MKIPEMSRALSVLFLALIQEVTKFEIHELNYDGVNNVQLRVHDVIPGKKKKRRPFILSDHKNKCL